MRKDSEKAVLIWGEVLTQAVPDMQKNSYPTILKIIDVARGSGQDFAHVIGSCLDIEGLAIEKAVNMSLPRRYRNHVGFRIEYISPGALASQARQVSGLAVNRQDKFVKVFNQNIPPAFRDTILALVDDDPSGVKVCEYWLEITNASKNSIERRIASLGIDRYRELVKITGTSVM